MTMTTFEMIMAIYLVGGVISGGIVGYLSRDKPWVRVLSALLIGATWPLSFPVALLFSLF